MLSRFLILFFFLTSFLSLWSQTTIEGIVVETGKNEPIIFATVEIYQNEKLISRTDTGLKGKFELYNLDIGLYKLEVDYVGLSSFEADIIIPSDNYNKTLLIELEEEGIIGCGYPIIKIDPPLIDHYNTSSGLILNASDIRNFSNRN